MVKSHMRMGDNINGLDLGINCSILFYLFLFCLFIFIGKAVLSRAPIIIYKMYVQFLDIFKFVLFFFLIWFFFLNLQRCLSKKKINK